MYIVLYIWTETILSKVKEAGFNVSLSNETHLTKEMAEQLYGEHRDKEYFEELTNMMTRWEHKTGADVLVIADFQCLHLLDFSASKREVIIVCKFPSHLNF